MWRGWILALLVGCSHLQPMQAQPAQPTWSGFSNFIPFGTPQFRNRQPRKGYVLAISQIATAAMSFGIFTYLSARYGLHGNIRPEDADGVRTLQQIEVVSGVAFLGLYGYGVTDAILNDRSR